MKTAFILLALVGTALSSVVERGVDNDKCNADNCARAVTGTRFPTSVIAQHKADCTSFMKVTKDPDHDYPKITPTAVPTYASACDGGARYSSACSCWGITVVTITKDLDDHHHHYRE